MRVDRRQSCENLKIFLYAIDALMLSSGTFRSLVFSFLGAKVHSGNFRSQERMFPGTFVPGSECSREHSSCRVIMGSELYEYNYKLHITHKLMLKPIY